MRRVGCSEWLARMQHFHELQRRIIRRPQFGEDLQPREPLGEIKLARFRICPAAACVRDGFDLQVLNTPLNKPALSVLKQCRAMPAVAGDRMDSHAMNLPRFGEVLHEREEGNDSSIFGYRERWQTRGVSDVHSKRIFDAEPLRQRPKHSFTLRLEPQLWAKKFHAG
jgi:hypothetical protein